MNKYSDKEQELLKTLSSKKIDLKDKGMADLEAQIETLKKEIDTLKTIIDIKEMEITKYKEKEMNEFLSELADNTPNEDQFKKV